MLSSAYKLLPSRWQPAIVNAKLQQLRFLRMQRETHESETVKSWQQQDQHRHTDGT